MIGQLHTPAALPSVKNPLIPIGYISLKYLTLYLRYIFFNLLFLDRLTFALLRSVKTQLKAKFLCMSFSYLLLLTSL
jgi:hypothetical protein